MSESAQSTPRKSLFGASRRQMRTPRDTPTATPTETPRDTPSHTPRQMDIELQDEVMAEPPARQEAAVVTVARAGSPTPARSSSPARSAGWTQKELANASEHVEPDYALHSIRVLFSVCGSAFLCADPERSGLSSRGELVSALEKALEIEQLGESEDPLSLEELEEFLPVATSVDAAIRSSLVAEVSAEEFELILEVVALQAMYQVVAPGDGQLAIRSQLVEFLETAAAAWSPRVLSKLHWTPLGSRSKFSSRCDWAAAALKKTAAGCLVWEELLTHFEKSIASEWLHQCEALPAMTEGDKMNGETFVVREQFAEMLDENIEMREQFSAIGRWRMRQPWTLNTAELSEAVQSIDTVGLSWSELDWQLSMAALSGVWFKHIDPEQQCVGSAQAITAMIEGEGFEIPRKELGSLLWLWQLADGTSIPRCVQIATDLSEQLSIDSTQKQPKFWCFGAGAESREPRQLGDQISWELFVDLMSVPYTLQTWAQLAITDVEDEVRTSPAQAQEEPIDNNQITYDDNTDDDDDEEKGNGVDWMTEYSSPEVQRWSEMAEQYNTQPSEIAFLQSIAQLSQAHKLEAVESPARRLEAIHSHSDRQQLDNILDEATSDTASVKSLGSRQAVDDHHEVHLQRNLYARSANLYNRSPESVVERPFSPSEVFEDSQQKVDAPTSTAKAPSMPFSRMTKRGYAKPNSIKAVQAAVLEYGQPGAGTVPVSPATMMELPASGNEPINAARIWRKRQQDLTQAWSENRRRSAKSTAKRSVNQPKLTRMGEALTFCSPEKMAVGAVSFDQSNNTARLTPTAKENSCAVHCYGSPFLSDATRHMNDRGVSDPCYRNGKNVGTVARQAVYTFPQSEAKRMLPDYNVGPGAYLPL